MTGPATPSPGGPSSGHAPDGGLPTAADPAAGRSTEGKVARATSPLVDDATLDVLDEAAAGAETVPAAASRRLEILCAVVAVLISGALVLLARAIELRTETGGIDPRWWPELLGTVGLVLAVVLLLAALLRPPFERDDLEAATRQGWVRVVAAVSLAVVFVVVWPLVGFVVAAVPFLVAVTYVFGGRGWKTLIVFPVLMTAFIYLLFHTVLKVPL